MKPNVKATLGFRLVISAPVMTDNKAIAELEKNWESYRRGVGSKTPAALSVADTATKEEVSANDALSRLERIGKALEDAGLKDSLRKELEGTRSALLDMVKVRRKADEDSARVWVKIACERGMYLSRNLNNIPAVWIELAVVADVSFCKELNRINSVQSTGSDKID